MNRLYLSFSISCVTRKEVAHMNIDFWNLLYTHLEERRYDSIYQNAKQDADYLKFSQQEQKFSDQYDNLDLSDEQRKVINHWVERANLK